MTVKSPEMRRCRSTTMRSTCCLCTLFITAGRGQFGEEYLCAAVLKRKKIEKDHRLHRQAGAKPPQGSTWR
jgi:hypothetical protein